MNIDMLAGDPVEKFGFDPTELRAKYRFERDKRLREDGNKQYKEIADAFASYNDDPYTERIERDPLEDEVQVAIMVPTGFPLASSRAFHRSSVSVLLNLCLVRYRFIPLRKS